MTNAICVKCQLRMVRVETGLDVELMAGTEGAQIWNGDKQRCPSCGVEVIAGFGTGPVAEYFQTARYAKFAKGVALRFWATLEDKAASNG